MGLGKTIQVIGLFAHMRQMGVNGAFFGCFDENCVIDGGNGTGHGRL